MMVGVDQFAAQFAELAVGVEIALGEHPPAEAVARFVQDRAPAGAGHPIGDGEPGDAAADDGDAGFGLHGRAPVRGVHHVHDLVVEPAHRGAGRKRGGASEQQRGTAGERACCRCAFVRIICICAGLGERPASDGKSRVRAMRAPSVESGVA